MLLKSAKKGKGETQFYRSSMWDRLIHKNAGGSVSSVLLGQNFSLSVLEPGLLAGVMVLKNVCLEGLEALLPM